MINRPSSGRAWFGLGGELTLPDQVVITRRNAVGLGLARCQLRATGRRGCNGERASGFPCQDGVCRTHAHLARNALKAAPITALNRCWRSMNQRCAEMRGSGLLCRHQMRTAPPPGTDGARSRNAERKPASAGEGDGRNWGHRDARAAAICRPRE